MTRPGDCPAVYGADGGVWRGSSPSLSRCAMPAGHAGPHDWRVFGMTRSEAGELARRVLQNRRAEMVRSAFLEVLRFPGINGQTFDQFFEHSTYPPEWIEVMREVSTGNRWLAVEGNTLWAILTDPAEPPAPSAPPLPCADLG